MGFENDLVMAGDGEGRWDTINGQFSFVPSVFCDVQSGGAQSCDIGLDLGYTWPENEGATQTAVKLRAEQASNSRYLALTFERMRRFETLNGELSYGASLSSKGAPAAKLTYKAEF